MSAGLEDYIKKQLNQGYSINAIRDYLLKSGYSVSDVNGAINAAYGKQTSPHKAAIALVLIVIVMLSIGIVLYYSYYLKPAPKLPLKFELNGMQMTSKAGGKISFSKTFSNFDAKKEVTVVHEIIDKKTNSKVASKTEYGTVSELKSSVEINVPDDAAAGVYMLKSAASQGGIQKTASLGVRIIEESEAPTCFDGILNQDEEEADCGGPCEACRKCPASCDDKSECTEDSCSESTDYKCRHEVMAPCCGNLECEPQEDYSSCPADCKKPSKTDPFDGLSPWEKLEKIKELAKSDERAASDSCDALEQQAYIDQCLYNLGEIASKEGYCDRIKDSRTKDTCLSKVAEKTSNKLLCDKISAENRRDTCYMNFVINGNDYALCDKVSNQYLRQSCESLKELSTMQPK